jgi:hypothetical protein
MKKRCSGEQIARLLWQADVGWTGVAKGWGFMLWNKSGRSPVITARDSFCGPDAADGLLLKAP